mgnify:CR=1 FL=1
MPDERDDELDEMCEHGIPFPDPCDECKYGPYADDEDDGEPDA